MAEISKESNSDEIALSSDKDGGALADSSKESVPSVAEIVDDNSSKLKDETISAVNGNNDASSSTTGDSTTEGNTEGNTVDVDDDEVSSSEKSAEEVPCNGDADDSETTTEQVDDSVTVIPGDQEVLISVDVGKLMKEGNEGQSPVISNGHVVDEIDDDDEDDDDDIVEVTPSERNVEESGEWSLKSRLQNFVRWCRSKGFIMSPKIEVTTEGTCHRYGMVATDDIKRGEVICSTPRAMIFNPDNSRIVAEIVNYEDWLDTIGQSLDESSGWATLLIALMVEYNDSQSFWAPYLRMVPKPEEYGHPLFWSIEEHKDELRGTTLLYDIQRDIYNIESEYKQFVLPFIYRYKDICGNVERYSLGLYKRLVAFVMAYSFTEDYGCEPNMIPLADILNHHSTKNNCKLVFGEDYVEVMAIKDIKKGDEILNTFGKLGNAELLQTYGYADKEPNVYDTLPILVNTFLDVMEKEEKVSDSYFQAKISLLNKTEIAHSDDFFLFDRNGMRRGPDLIQMLKILFMPEEQFDELLKQRAGNRPDSFYQKLLRKLKLSKRTDTSSGVAVIDIIESDDEPDEDNTSGCKRKMDVDEIEIDDGEPPAKQSCDTSSLRVPVVQRLTHGDSDSFLSTLATDNGDSACNAILIDDDDSDTENEVEMDGQEISTEDADGDKSEDTDNSKAEACAEDKNGEADEANKENKEEINSEVAASDSGVEISADDEKKVEANEVEDIKESEKDDDKDSTKQTNESKQELKDEVDKEEKVESEENVSREGLADQPECSDKVEKSEPTEAKDLSDSQAGQAGQASLPNIFTENQNGSTEKEEATDDIEIVSEDIRCKMTYNILNNELDRPGWRDFIKRVINFQTNSLKADDLLTADEARQKMTDRQFYSCQIRQGQRQIAKTFISSLKETPCESLGKTTDTGSTSDLDSNLTGSDCSTTVQVDSEPGK